MGIIYYLICFSLALALNIVFVSKWQKKCYSYFAMLFVLVTISNGGYLALAMSGTVEEAILSNKIAYIGGCFLPLLIFLNIANMCKVKINRVVNILLFIWCTLIYLCVFSVGYSELYYKSVDIGTKYGITYMIRNYGKLHIINTISVCVISIASIVVVIHAFTKQKKISFINTLVLLIILVISSVAFIVRNICTPEIEKMPIVYILDLIVIFFMYARVEKYDVTTSIVEVLQRQESYGYIVFNNNLKYVGSNEVAIDYFPEVESWKVDSDVSDSDFAERIKVETSKLKSVSSYTWHQRSSAYELKCILKKLYDNNKECGYIVEISDDTLQREYIKLISSNNRELEKAVKEKVKHIQDMQDQIILGMANVVESRDYNTGGHVKRTSDVVKIFVEELKQTDYKQILSREFFQNVVKAAPMHDLGKIGIDDAILRKPGKFTAEEYKQMKTHAIKGVEMIDTLFYGVEDKEYVQLAKNIAHYHHEKYNGEGYPEHLVGEDIPIEARIMALADVFDALVSKRCYKEKMDYDKAFDIIEDSIGSHFDPRLGKIFIKCRPKLEEYYDSVI